VPQFEITTSSMDDLESLYDHLRSEELTGVRAALGQGEPEPGHQGAAEILTVLFTSGSGLALAQAVNAWVRTRQKQVRLTWKRTDDGEEVAFEATGPDADRTLERLLAADHPPAPPAVPAPPAPPAIEHGQG